VVTASFNKDSALSIEGQDPNDNPPPPSNDTPQNVLIQINENDLIFFNQERVDISAVRARIAQQRAENPSASVIVKPNAESTANVLVSVMNQAHEAGISTISVIE
jgi:biopolymer transport protein ExbD